MSDGGRATYETLDEQAGQLSEAEERFERKRRTTGLFLAPAVFLVLLVFPDGADDGRSRTWRPYSAWCWCCGSRRRSRSPWPGIVGVCLCVMLQVTEDTDEIFASFSNSTVFLFIGSFIIAEAMLVHRLDRRLAFTVLGMRFVGTRPPGSSSPSV